MYLYLANFWLHVSNIFKLKFLLILNLSELLRVDKYALNAMVWLV